MLEIVTQAGLARGDPAPAALVDAAGTILAVNRPWVLTIVGPPRGTGFGQSVITRVTAQKLGGRRRLPERASGLDGRAPAAALLDEGKMNAGAPDPVSLNGTLAAAAAAPIFSA